MGPANGKEWKKNVIEEKSYGLSGESEAEKEEGKGENIGGQKSTAVQLETPATLR